MSFLDLPPSVKSPEELEVEKAMQEYFEHFGEHWGWQIGWDSVSMEDAPAYIRQHIAENRKKEAKPYKEGLDY